MNALETHSPSLVPLPTETHHLCYETLPPVQLCIREQSDLLPLGCQLVIDFHQRTITLLFVPPWPNRPYETSSVRIIRTETFSSNGIKILCALLSFSSYCSLDYLLAALQLDNADLYQLINTTAITSNPLFYEQAAEYAKMLKNSHTPSEREWLLRPFRRSLQEVKKKLALFGMTIFTLREHGYRITKHPQNVKVSKIVNSEGQTPTQPRIAHHLSAKVH